MPGLLMMNEVVYALRELLAASGIAYGSGTAGAGEGEVGCECKKYEPRKGFDAS
jgi:hypothetical protein